MRKPGQHQYPNRSARLALTSHTFTGAAVVSVASASSSLAFLAVVSSSLAFVRSAW